MSKRKIIKEAKSIGWGVLKINNLWRVNTGGYHYLTSRHELIQDIKREKRIIKWRESPEGIEFNRKFNEIMDKELIDD
jgi:hypothetical protein